MGGKLATLTERLDAVCMGLGITNKEGIQLAIERFVETEEYNKKIMEGCGGKHSCCICSKDFECWNFCGQTFHHECKVCHFSKNVRDLRRSGKW